MHCRETGFFHGTFDRHNKNLGGTKKVFGQLSPNAPPPWLRAWLLFDCVKSMTFY